MTDCQLLEQMRARSESAITAFSEQYGAYCRSIAFRILRNEEDVEECFNDVCFKLWNAVTQKEIQNLKCYIAVATRNAAVDILNKRNICETSDGEWYIYAELEECLGCDDGIEAVTDAVVIKDTLNAFLTTLNTTERWMFMRRYWAMDSIGTIASMCGKRESAVRMTLSRIRKKLKARLEKEGIVL